MKIWKPGLLSDYKKSGGHEFVLAEKPWWCESTEAIKTRYFICDMLELLYARVSGELADKYIQFWLFCVHASSKMT